ncbi:c-type cytochrome [Microvirga solisilvae]|uniref:c-type cytochrome n=1 Tax=Microvirga solisilvae TaxID=2919498 RepID=UPI001FAEE8EA|nr:c-type cytochrome [Microvirga solisilvae]
MPMRRARSWTPIAVTLLAGVAGALLGFGKGAHAGRSGKAPRPAFDPQAHLTGIHIPTPVRLQRQSVVIGFILVLLAGAGIYAGYAIKFTQDARQRAIALTGGDPDLGRDLTKRYGCAGCHTIPGVPGAQGKVGPTLEGFAARVYIGGVAANSPDTLIQWIEDPKSIDPKTAMPVTGISRREARHVAAYLYSLR